MLSFSFHFPVPELDQHKTEGLQPYCTSNSQVKSTHHTHIFIVPQLMSADYVL